VTKPSRLSIGGIEFQLLADELPVRLRNDEAYRAFLAAPPLLAERDGALAPSRVVRVRHSVTSSPRLEGETVFASGATWTILAKGPGRSLAFRYPDGELVFVARFRPGSFEVMVECTPRLLMRDETGSFVASPFHYPLDQILTMYLLAEAGVLVHAAGALVGGRGLAFAGVSGAGKSTLMGLAFGRRGWVALSDDRVIVRAGAAPTVHGTPWPGSGQAALNDQGPLAALLFLEQGPAHAIRRLEPREALTRLLRTTSVPWYDAEYLDGILGACGRLASGVPSAVLQFHPDTKAIDLVERVLEESDRG
jgi:hypothetical protein